MKPRHFLISAIAAPLLLGSCSNNDDQNTPLGSYDQGVLVLNEGGLGTVSYISNDLQTIQQDIFTSVNGADADLGAYTQSIFFSGSRAFVISNGSNKITVVDRYTFEKLGEISSGLAVPRYGVVHDGKAYVTNSNTFESATDDFIAVINLQSLSVTSTIPVNNQAERLVEENGKLYVSGGFYGSGNVVTVINTANNQIVTTIDVGESPNSLEADEGVLYVLCSTWGGPSKLVRILLSSNEVFSETVFDDSLLHAENLDIEDHLAYFTSGSRIYYTDLGATSVTDTPFIETGPASGFIGYGFAVGNGKIYIAEAADDFASNGKVFVYAESNGALLATIPVGLGPNGFYFND